ncbi:MAG: hypothetical protein QM699_06460 [Amaricoccus sp.]|uniref:hypothetical protein n=1 Tax=Amaricoccus sp. TaxID=1872485 RepID=UPI0039E30EFF
MPPTTPPSGTTAHSPARKLEDLIARIGEAAVMYPGAPRPPAGDTLKVLHVATEFHQIGGHSRMAGEWVRLDTGNRHALALTRQHSPVPPAIAEAFRSTGGTVVRLNCERGNMLHWAASLQRLMADADVVVLHVHSMDILPFLACAGMQRRPPILFVNHTDHLFWVGARFADLVVSSRHSGNALSLRRRGIPRERLATFPLCLSEHGWQVDRAAARAQLGLEPDDVLILSVARGSKFSPVGSQAFPDPFVSLLQRNPRVKLYAVGPGGDVDWSGAEAATGGRVRAIHATPDTAPFYAAADIYLDSFPFVSITSLLEAGRAGLPLVTRDPFGPDCRVMGADTIGFDDSIVRCRSTGEAVSILQGLIDDHGLRRRLGDAARAEIEGHNLGNAWQAELKALYRRALATPPARIAGAQALGPVSDLDRFLPFVYADQQRGATRDSRFFASVEPAIKAGPLVWRLRTLVELRRRRLSAGQIGRWAIPEWLTCRVRDILRRHT